MSEPDDVRILRIKERFPKFPAYDFWKQLEIVQLFDGKSPSYATADGTRKIMDRAQEIWALAQQKDSPERQEGSSRRKQPETIDEFYAALAGQAVHVLAKKGKTIREEDEMKQEVTLLVRRGDAFDPKCTWTTWFACSPKEDMDAIIRESLASYAVTYHVPTEFVK